MRSPYRLLLILVLSLCLAPCAASPVLAQEGLTFETALKGLPAQKEGNMIRDREGFLWFCYYGGVGRYDGYEIKYYEPGPDSLSGPAAISLALDHNGVLWIHTKDDGLNRYDKATDTFTHFKHDPNDPKTISSNLSDSFCSQRLFVDSRNRILVGTMSGLNIYDQATGAFTHHRHDPDNSNSLSSDNVTAVIQGDDGIIWVGTAGGGLNRFDEAAGTWTRYQYEAGSDKGPASNTVWSLLEDRDGTLWVGTWDRGLSRFDKNTQTFTHFQHDPGDPTSLGDNKVYSLYEDSAGRIWICHKDSDVAGMEMLNEDKTGFIRFSANSSNPSSISSNFVSTVYEDPVTGIFWVIHTFAESFDKYDKNSRKFTLHSHDPANPKSLASPMVLVMQEDEEGKLWIAVADGLNIYDRDTGEFTFLPFKEVSPEMGNITIAMCPEPGGAMWILSTRGVLTLFDTKTRKPIRHYMHDPDDPDSIMLFTSAGGNVIQDKDDPNILWLSNTAGIERFDKTTGKFTHFVHDPNDPNTITRGTVWSVYDDGKGQLWASTFGGLCVMDKRTGAVTRYNHDPNNPDSIGFDKQSRVFEDSFGNFWVAGFADGMDLMDRQTGTFTHFNKRTGLPATGINQTIQEDTQGNLWLGTTDNGLIKFNIKERKVEAVYSKSDGLQDNHFWRSYKTRDGEMWFGGGFGLNSFRPEEVTRNMTVPPIVLTSLNQGGTRMPLGKAPELLKELHLGWQENFFEFQFAALNYSKPEKNEYAYMLEGRDKDWYYTSRPSGRYTGLEGGTYTLRLKGSNNDGIWNEEGTALTIVVTPPFWRTGWFYSLHLGVAAIVVASIFIYLTKLRHEIAEREQAEVALSKSEEKYRILVENAPDLRYRTDTEGKITFISQSVLELSGYTVEEALGMNMAQEVYAVPEQRSNLLQQLSSQGFVDNFVSELKRKDGSTWWAATNAHFFKDEDGTILGVEGVTRDISKQVRAEQERNQLREYLLSFINSMPSVLVGVDSESRVTLWNMAAENISGIPRDKAIGQDLYEVLPRLKPRKKELTQALESHKPRVEQRKAYATGKGTIYEDIGIYPLMESGVEGAVIRIDDVTERIKLEQMMVQSEKMLSVGGLAAGMAHEINNPLGGILQGVQNLARRLTGDLPANRKAAEAEGISLESMRRYMESRNILGMLEGIKASGERSAQIVRNMLDFSRESSSSPATCDLNQLLDTTLDIVASDYDPMDEYDFKKIKIVKDYEKSALSDSCISTELEQVFLNLFRNAAQAMNEDADPTKMPRLFLRTRVFEDRTVIEVEDNGPGMTETTRKRIFEPFFTTKKPGKGTGLGLSVSYFIITQNHGGTFNVESKPGLGTKFTITLPQ